MMYKTKEMIEQVLKDVAGSGCKDLHTYLTARRLNKDLTEFSKLIAEKDEEACRQRKLTKDMNFGVLYGGGGDLLNDIK